MTSIREVARIAGVSPATVSRVMNGTAKVNEEKRKRVEAAIEETGFRPNELARALYKQSSKMIGAIVPDIENPFLVNWQRLWKTKRIKMDIGLCSAILAMIWKKRWQISDVPAVTGRWNYHNDKLCGNCKNFKELSGSGCACRLQAG